MDQSTIHRKATAATKGLYPFKEIGRRWVRCRQCGASGYTSARLVGRARTIDQCGKCRQATAA